MQDTGFHSRVQQAYERLIGENPERFLVVNAAQDRDAVEKDALEAVVCRLTALEQR